MTRALARYEGILAGPSGGAGVLAAVRWRKRSAGRRGDGAARRGQPVPERPFWEEGDA